MQVFETGFILNGYLEERRQSMRYLSLIFLLSLFINSAHSGLSWEADSEGTIYDKIHKKADLPTGGEFVKHPKNAKVQYYFTNKSRMWNDKSNAQKHAGLYISEDGGDTWKLLCYFFQFNKLFIHPETGKLYCIIDYTWLAENRDGFLWPHTSNKALMSDDGKHWKDITGGNGYITDIASIIADPDNVGRICLRVAFVRPYILQAKDDDYSRWTWYKEWDWPKREELKARQLLNEPNER